jgi:hypothetical protein
MKNTDSSPTTNEQADFCGIYSGRKVDESAVFGLFIGKKRKGGQK